MANISSNSNKASYFDCGDTVQLDKIADALGDNIPSRRVKPRVVITVPAHNEEKLIGRCIASIAGQRTIFGHDLDMQEFEILVLCHNCTDMTREMSLQMLSTFPSLNLIVLETNRPEVNNVGAVRRILMRIASSRIGHNSGYIAMTDADSVAHPYWLANILGYIGSGYGLLCGKIEVDTKGISGYGKSVLALRKRYDNLWILLQDAIVPDPSNPAPRHGNNSGPNMAVRADVYDGVGGIDPLGFCEDIAFYDKIIYAGHKVRHCPMIIVTTSGRTEPRAPWGFGAELSTWNGNNGTGLQVESLEALLERLRIYRSVRKYLVYGIERDLWSAVRRSGLDHGHLLKHIQKFQNQGALILRLEKDLDNSVRWRERHPHIGISQACEELENYLSLTSDFFCQTCNL